MLRNWETEDLILFGSLALLLALILFLLVGTVYVQTQCWSRTQSVSGIVKQIDTRADTFVTLDNGSEYELPTAQGIRIGDNITFVIHGDYKPVLTDWMFCYKPQVTNLTITH